MWFEALKEEDKSRPIFFFGGGGVAKSLFSQGSIFLPFAVEHKNWKMRYRYFEKNIFDLERYFVENNF